MNDRDHDRAHDELAHRLRSVASAIEPASTLDERVRDRLRVRRRRRAMQVVSASAMVMVVGASALVLTNDDRRERVSTGESLPSVPDVLDDSIPVDGTASTVEHTAETFPASDEQAVNILVVGTDNGACIERDSPYAGGFGDRSTMGERSDTIMIVRVDPAADRASILSLPRDLWVAVDGRGHGRINSAFVRNDPQKLINTIYANFGLGVDHFVQLDFCGFTTIVDAVGGVSVPFDSAVRDTHTGLFVPEPGCHTFAGDEALAYVRARYYETQDEAGTWTNDPHGDLGRIARQQDFVQRTVMAVFGAGFGDPDVVRALIRTVDDYVVVDRGLTIARMLELAGELQAMDPNTIGRYQIEGHPEHIDGSYVLIPDLDTPSMQQILSLFGGQPTSEAVPSSVTASSTTPADNVTPTAPPTITCP